MAIATVPTTGVSVETFRAQGDGCLGYLVVDEGSRTGLAIDPRLDDLDRFVDAATARDVRLVYVLDTHTHADHLSGVRALARRTGATVMAHTGSKLKGPARRLAGGMSFELGTTTVRVLDAPGHTPDSLALLADGHLFTGDALFAGGAGRTDFMGGSPSDLFDTFRQLETLPDATLVHPGHDYVGRPVTTIGEEKASNALFRERDRAALVSRLAAKGTAPANMASILRHNLGESDAATLGPRDLHALREEGRDVLVVDVRSALEFEGERIEGALNIPLEVLDARLEEVPDVADVVVVCRTGVRATIAAESLARAGRRPRVLEGGILGWRRARLPLREGRKRLPVDRQVQLIAGSMVFAGVALGTLVNPWFLVIPAFFGAGLTFAGATGTCGLALVLLKMPWNRPLGLPADGAGATCAAPVAATCAAPAPPER
jgi:glyoxylase-like metal-dependent hydrolase (beta-lactamase superfamily II)